MQPTAPQLAALAAFYQVSGQTAPEANPVRDAYQQMIRMRDMRSRSPFIRDFLILTAPTPSDAEQAAMETSRTATPTRPDRIRDMAQTPFHHEEPREAQLIKSMYRDRLVLSHHLGQPTRRF